MKQTKQIVLSGIQPSGELHIGNYLGSLKNFVELQNKYQCYFFLATYHSITEDYNPKTKKQDVFNLTLDFLAAGLDPKKCIIFNQVDVPECTELAWIFNTITPIAELERMTQFKDKATKQIKNINAGLLDYPVLQAADILLYHAHLIPVGQDQIQHVEITRDIARHFNNKFGQYFFEPKPLLTKVPKVMSLLEPEKKMSKSAGPNHYIAINDEPDVIHEKLKRAVTGTGNENTIPLGAQNLLTLLQEFGTAKQVAYFQEQIKNKKIRYSELKEALTKAIADYFADFRTKRKALAKKPQVIEGVLRDGANKAQKVAQKTLNEVKNLIGVA
ncbi:MAG: tryptophan--tRNA ligase [Candidatus Buchananbacteria bacterium RBG_13_39_9]|uniref:Tryptophan--tRNA ligase n=1 Tax=Candidatus Buchananbacteria bacterium RBG_13_39_9 TaxID=1797531 RepID=A0A1G1XRF3_9BACT|nr:MAG: tryptophan--tRNA ligase [Candidatus Buchananbacteria bacterium RBG_13_39_9]